MGVLSEKGLDAIVAEQRGDPGALLMVPTSACVYYSGDCSLNLRLRSCLITGEE